MTSSPDYLWCVCEEVQNLVAECGGVVHKSRELCFQFHRENVLNAELESTNCIPVEVLLPLTPKFHQMRLCSGMAAELIRFYSSQCAAVALCSNSVTAPAIRSPPQQICMTSIT